MQSLESAGRTELMVRDIMHTEVITVVPEMTVRELAQTFVEQRISGAPVLDPTGKLVGVVSTTDVMQLIAREAEIPLGQVAWVQVPLREEMDDDFPATDLAGAVAFTFAARDSLPESGLDQYSVGDIMTPVAFTVHPSSSLAETVRFLLRGRVHRALVVEHDILLGIVTPFDILQALDTLPMAPPLNPSAAVSKISG